MIMADLKTNYVDDVLDTTKNQLRKYQQIQNDDGTVSFVDVTEYTQVGTSFGAKDMNDTNAAINDVNRKLDKNSLGMPIDLSSYTQSNKYTLPSDGYIQARASSTNLSIMVAIEGKNNDSPTLYISADWQTDRYATNSIYAKKGMRVYMITSNGGATFYPIS